MAVYVSTCELYKKIVIKHYTIVILVSKLTCLDFEMFIASKMLENVRGCARASNHASIFGALLRKSTSESLLRERTTSVRLTIPVPFRSRRRKASRAAAASSSGVVFVLLIAEKSLLVCK